MANCPICGRHLGEFTNDPLLTTPSLSTDEFKGFTTLITTHITELQIERHQQEIDNGITPLTEFTPINNTGFFQNIKSYIQELRDSTEKILVTTGQTLTEFLSTDEDGNPMTSKSDWTDSNLEEIKYQCKAIHIEDLRHFISLGIWIEKWQGFPDFVYLNEDYVNSNPNKTHNFPCLVLEGNKGDWNLTSNAITQSAFLVGSQEVTSICKILSEKLTLYIKQKLIITTPVGAGVPFARADMGIYNDLSYILKNNTYFSFNGTNYINNESGIGVIFNNRFNITITFADSKIIRYGFDSDGGWDFDLTESDFLAFNRNLYTDYVTKYGIPIGNPEIVEVQFRITFAFNSTTIGVYEAERQGEIDNIKFSNVI